jgi:hypothetical protein
MIRLLFFTLTLLQFEILSAQTECRIFSEYKNEIKIWGKSTIDSLKNGGVDTILFYGQGIPNTGRMVYGKIIWTFNGEINKLEITSSYYNNEFHLSIPKFTTNTSDAGLKFYSEHRLDTVTTNPKELNWMSHDFLHFVYSSISRVEICIIAENYLLEDQEHLRSKWIKVLSENVLHLIK